MNKSSIDDSLITEVNNFFTKKEFVKAEKRLFEFTKQNPKNHIGFYLLGSNYSLMNRLKLAEIYYNKCNEIKKFAPAYKSLATIYFKLNKMYKNPKLTKQAIIFLKTAIDINPGFYPAHLELGNLYKANCRFEEAIAQYKKGIETNPKNAEAYLILGNVFKDKKNFSEALKTYQKGIEINPNFIEAYYNISQVYLQLNELGSSLQYLKKILEKKLNSARIHIKIANNYLMQKNYKFAEEFFRKGLDLRESNIKNSNQYKNEINTGELINIYLDQGLAEIYNNLSAALRLLDRDDESLMYVNKALAINSNHFSANLNLSNFLLMAGDYEAAFKINNKFKNDPKMGIVNFFNSQFQMIPIPRSSEEIDQYRKILLSNIKDFKLKRFPIRSNEGGDNSPLFFISYHNQDNINFAKELSSSMLIACQDVNFESNFSQYKKGKNSKIRIMFVSEHLHNHTIGKLYRGYIKEISRKKFEVIAACVNFRNDSISNEIKNYADKFINLSPILSSQRKEILSEKPDIIFYTDIGFSTFSYFLSFSRLAPVQFTSWGHPDTTGVKSIDYFLSSTKMERSDSKKYYTENLIMIDRLPMYYYPPVINKNFSKKELGIDHKGTLYGCLQSLFKLHPDFDEIITKIVNKDKNSKILMIEQKNGRWNKILQDRWSKKYPVLLDKVQFIRRLSVNEFASLTNCCDVLLDPFHFGSGNSFHESMLHGTPTVSLIGEFMRSRVVYGAYQQMKIDHAPVTKNYDEYINLAVDLALDKKKNLALREKLKLASQEYLYRDKESVVQFETFLEATLSSFNKNKKLEDGLVIS